MVLPPVRLDDAQLRAARCFMSERNVAVVGAAGCGKTVLLSYLIRASKQKWGPDAVAVLAWRGSVAQLVGGQTVSSFLRVTVGDPSKERILSRILGNETARREIARVRVVFIDEAPTIQGRWLDRLEFVFRLLASPMKQCRPFGGRLVFGEFSAPSLWTLLSVCCQQSGSVSRVDRSRTISSRGASYHALLAHVPFAGIYTFSLFPLVVYLVFECAAAGDPLQLAAYRVTDSSVEKGAYLERSWDDSFFSAYGTVMELDGHHRQVGNDPLLRILSRLRVGECREEDVLLLNSTWADASECWPDHHHLRAKVVDANEFNNSRLSELCGEVGTFVCRDALLADHPDVRAAALGNLDGLAPRTISVKHGARVVCTMSCGAVRTGAHGTVVTFSAVTVSCEFVGVAGVVELPFTCFTVKDHLERVLATRMQIPLLLGWAVTVSRAQGMTLDKVAVDFSCTTWTLDGLVYAALSRATCLSALRVRGLTRAHVMTSSNALSFYEKVRYEGRFRERRVGTT